MAEKGGIRELRGRDALIKDEKLPLITVITISFNAYDCLLATIKSIHNQTYPNIEHVIIDGASNDGTLDLIKQYDHVIGYWQSEQDQGIYDAMNKGIKQASGEYLWFINTGDQIARDETVTNLAATFEKQYDIIYGETELIDDKGQVLGTRSELTTRKLPAKLSWRSLKKGMVVSHQSFIVKKKISPYYKSQFQCSADIDWMIQAIKNSRSVARADEPLAKYLLGGTSLQIRGVCWRERFIIYAHHFGLIQTIGIHIYFLVRVLLNKLFGQPLKD